MSYGRLSDDPLEESVLIDDQIKFQEELDKEMMQYDIDHGEGRNGYVGAGILLFVLIAVFVLWFFFG